MGKILKEVYQCDLKGCENTSFNPMPEIVLVAYDEKADDFLEKKYMVCKKHQEKYLNAMNKIKGKKSANTKKNPEIMEKDRNLMKVQKDLNSCDNRGNIKNKEKNKCSINENKGKISLSSEIKERSPFYNHHQFKISKNDSILSEKYDVYIFPLEILEDSHGVEIGVLIEIKDQMMDSAAQINLVSEKKKRKTVQYDNEEIGYSLTCRGMWEHGKFKSIIYVKSLKIDRQDKYSLESQNIRQYGPKIYHKDYYEQHYLYQEDNDELKLNIVPLKQNNYITQQTKILVVVETKYQRRILSSDQQGIVIMNYDDKKYKIVGSWQNEDFIISVDSLSG